MGQQFTITLPEDLARIVRQQVEDGTYASIDEMVDLALRDSLATVEDDVLLERWVRSEGMGRLRAFEANPSGALSLDEVDQMIEREFGETGRRP